MKLPKFFQETTHHVLPISLTVMLSTMLGCSAEEPVIVEDNASGSNLVELIGSNWHVEDIDGRGIVDNSMTTLQFIDEVRVIGSTGCNRYFGNAKLGDDQIKISDVGSTRRACVPALMNQEQLFLQALQSASSLMIENDTSLVLYDNEGTRRLKMMEIEPELTVNHTSGNVAQDRENKIVINLDCGGGANASFRFLGPDTLELTMADNLYVLLNERVASGARYANDGVSFWNKGAEAILEISSTKYNCSFVKK